MQSAFVNIGLDRSAFLYGGDVVDPDFITAEVERRRREAEARSRGEPEADTEDDPRRLVNRTPIEKLLRSGDEIMVQVAKEPLGSKGPRVTMLVTIPGRYLVLVPDFDNIGISRRIEDEQTREDLRVMVDTLKPEGMGIIIRTAAAGMDRETLSRDLEYLKNVWTSVQEGSRNSPCPGLLYQEPDLILKTTRDLYTEDVREIVVDDPRAYSQLKHFLTDTIPEADSKLVLYTNPDPIFDTYGAEMDIAAAMSRRVWLPSGGYLVVDQTEALTTFDVNSGRFVGHRNVKDTALKINLEAAEAVAAQLRLRNLGGIIVIDFIDMEDLADREKVSEEFEKYLKVDKARTNVLAMNELGLVQLTRKRTRESLERLLTHSCPQCHGRGVVNTTETDAYEMVREIERYALRTAKKEVTARARPEIIELLSTVESQLRQELTHRYDINLNLEPIKKEGPAWEVGD